MEQKSEQSYGEFQAGTIQSAKVCPIDPAELAQCDSCQ